MEPQKYSIITEEQWKTYTTESKIRLSEVYGLVPYSVWEMLKEDKEAQRQAKRQAEIEKEWARHDDTLPSDPHARCFAYSEDRCKVTPECVWNDAQKCAPKNLTADVVANIMQYAQQKLGEKGPYLTLLKRQSSGSDRTSGANAQILDMIFHGKTPRARSQNDQIFYWKQLTRVLFSEQNMTFDDLQHGKNPKPAPGHMSFTWKRGSRILHEGSIDLKLTSDQVKLLEGREEYSLEKRPEERVNER